jgi:hypothetical protein
MKHFDSFDNNQVNLEKESDFKYEFTEVSLIVLHNLSVHQISQILLLVLIYIYIIQSLLVALLTLNFIVIKSLHISMIAKLYNYLIRKYFFIIFGSYIIIV